MHQNILSEGIVILRREPFRCRHLILRCDSCRDFAAGMIEAGERPVAAADAMKQVVSLKAVLVRRLCR